MKAEQNRFIEYNPPPRHPEITETGKVPNTLLNKR